MVITNKLISLLDNIIKLNMLKYHINTLKLFYYKLLLTYITFNNKLYYPLIQNNKKKYSHYRELIEKINYNY